MATSLSCLTAAACLVLLAACDRGAGPASPSTAGSPAPAVLAGAPAASTETVRTPACALVPAERMSALLGAPVTATDPSPNAVGKTACRYEPRDGSLPMAELSLEYGSAEAAMAASGMLGRVEPGMTNPYEGLGDQATAIGPAVWIRKGDDLVAITVMGVDAHDAVVRDVYALVAPHL